MLELAYRSKNSKHQEHTFTLMQYQPDEPYLLMIDGVVLGKLNKKDRKWYLTEGHADQDLIDEVGGFIDDRDEEAEG